MVGPPLLDSWMWSIWGNSGGSSQLGWKQRAVADLDGSVERTGEEPASGADVDHAGRGVEHDAFDVGVGEPPRGGAGRDHRAVEQLEQRAGEGLVADEHVEQRSGAASVGGGGAGSGGHLDEGVGPALGGRAVEVEDRGFATEALLGGGPVGFEELALDELQGGVDDLTRDRVERDLAEPHAAERSADRCTSRALRSSSAFLFGTVGVDERSQRSQWALKLMNPTERADSNRILWSRSKAFSVRAVRTPSIVVTCDRSISPAAHACSTSGRSRIARAWRSRWRATEIGMRCFQASHAAAVLAPRRSPLARASPTAPAPAPPRRPARRAAAAAAQHRSVSSSPTIASRSSDASASSAAAAASRTAVEDRGDCSSGAGTRSSFGTGTTDPRRSVGALARVSGTRRSRRGSPTHYRTGVRRSTTDQGFLAR